MIWTRPTNGQFYFGRNKVQYEQFRWQVMASMHFDSAQGSKPVWKFPATTGLIKKKNLPYRMKYSLDFAQAPGDGVCSPE
ncbi:MAG: hypothetical protein WC703_04130 [Candidatus Neomarinimicrobiota bacterium]